MRRFIPQQSDCRRPSQSSFRIIASLLATALLSLVAPLADAAPQPGPEQVLRAWSRASQLIVGVSKSAQKRAFLQHEDEFNSHQIALMNEFKGPINADQLLKRYRFTEVKRDGRLLRLKAVNRDDVERLFIAGFEVEFSDDAWLPISLQFINTDGKHQGDSIPLVTSPPQTVAAVFDRSAVKPEQTAVRVASAVENPAANKVEQADAEFPAKQGEDSKRLQEVLNNWKAQASRTRTVRARFRLYEYDDAFRVEKRSQGTLTYRAPDKARIDVEPSELPAGTTSQKLDNNGDRYKIDSDGKAYSWIWWKHHCCLVSHDSKRVDVFAKSKRAPQIRKTSFGQSMSDAFVDLLQLRMPLLGGWTPLLETDFEWSITKETPTALHLKGIPQNEMVKRSLSELAVILDSQSYRLRAVKYVDPGRNSESVYVVQDMMRNVDDDAVEFADPTRFEAPLLPGYQTIKHGR